MKHSLSADKEPTVSLILLNILFSNTPSLNCAAGIQNRLTQCRVHCTEIGTVSADFFLFFFRSCVCYGISYNIVPDLAVLRNVQGTGYQMYHIYNKKP
eukprot:SAG11_NODE_1997_length_3945_cov_56.897556_3_plen_98_part_00